IGDHSSHGELGALVWDCDAWRSHEADHLGLATNVTSHLAQSTLSSPSLSSAARKSRSSFATCRASTGRKSLACLCRISPTVIVGPAHTLPRRLPRKQPTFFGRGHAGHA